MHSSLPNFPAKYLVPISAASWFLCFLLAVSVPAFSLSLSNDPEPPWSDVAPPWDTSQMRHPCEHHPDAECLLRHAADSAAAIGNDRVRADSYKMIGGAWAVVGNMDAVREMYGRALHDIRQGKRINYREERQRDIASRFLQFGDLTSALSVARGIEDEGVRGDTLATIASALQGDAREGVAVLIARSIEFAWSRATSFAQIAAARRNGGRAGWRKLLMLAESAAWSVESVASRASALNQIGHIWCAAGLVDKCRALLVAASDDALSSRQPNAHSLALPTIAEALSRAGFLDPALQIAAAVHPRHRDRTLVKVIVAYPPEKPVDDLVDALDGIAEASARTRALVSLALKSVTPMTEARESLFRAEMLAAGLDHPSSRDNAWTSITVAWIRLGDVGLALDASRRDADAEQRAARLLRAARVAARRGMVDPQHLLGLARIAAEEIEGPSDRSQFFVRLFDLWADNDSARQVLSSSSEAALAMPSGQSRDLQISLIAMRHLKLDDPIAASRLATEIEDAVVARRLAVEVAMHLARNGDSTSALAMARDMRPGTERIHLLHRLSVMLDEHGAREQANRLREMAITEAFHLTSASKRAQSLARIATGE